jgi:hypothetical protein
VLDGRGAHAGNGEGREANHHADNGDDDQKLDEGEGETRAETGDRKAETGTRASGRWPGSLPKAARRARRAGASEATHKENLARRRGGAEGEALAREWGGMDANGDREGHQGRGGSPRWIPFVALWLRVRICFHSRGFA